jgi:alginate O-acetyltransferase complex protein AlgI
MLFNSYNFIFLFLPLSILSFYLCNLIKKELAIYVLIFFSVIFYLISSYQYIYLLMLTVFVNFIFVKFTKSSKKKFFFFLIIIFNIIIFLYFKFFKFSFDSNYFIIPLGFSFYILNQIAFLVDFYYDKIKNPTFVKFFFLVSFFPHLIAGPFLRYNPIISQLKNNKYFIISLDKFFFGLIIFSAGLFKKVIIADKLGIYVDNFHENLNISSLEPKFVTSFFASFSYTLQLYFDFSGYSDMAIGIAMFFGIKLPVNFDSPFKSTNIINYWKTWHITLSNYIFEFIYVPIFQFLGRYLSFKSSFINNFFITFFPAVITFVIAGLWHGSGKNGFFGIINFFIFGMLHGIFFYLTHLFKNYEFIKNKYLKKLFGILITFNFVNFALIFFRSSSLNDSILIIKGLLGLNGFGYHPFLYSNKIRYEDLEVWNFSYDTRFLLYFILFASSLFIVFFGQNFNKYSCDKNFQKKILNSKTLTIRLAVFSSFLLALSILGIYGPSTFLYFNF